MRISLLSVVIVVLLSSSVCADLTHRYSFVSNANDSVGSAHGTLVGNAVVSGGELILDGTDDWMELPGSAIAINTYTSASVEAWFTLNAMPNWQRLFDFGDTSGGNGGYYWFYTPSSSYGDSRLVISTTGFPGYSSEELVTVPNPPTGTPVHLVCVYDSNDGKMRIYQDGDLVSSNNVTMSLSDVSDEFAYIGKSVYTADPELNGSIDELRIYNSALTDDIVDLHYNDGPDIYREELPVIIEQTDGLTEITEGNSISDEYTIALSSQPMAIVAITADPDVQLDIGNGPNNPAVLYFDTNNWNTPQTIEVTAVDDNDLEKNPHKGTIVHYLSSNDPDFNDIYSPTVSVDIWENECGAWGYIYADLNFDCVVDFKDLAILASLWLSDYDTDDLETLTTGWLSCTTPYAPGCVQGEYSPGTGYLFSYFEGQSDGLHLAYSYDGLNWTELNNGQTFLAPAIGSGLMRDPCIIKGLDGLFHMVWTTGWGDNGIGYASSPDLINWSEQTYIPVMAHEPDAQNCWAPEVFYDKAKQRYQIFWSTTITGEYNNQHRIYFVTTEDFETFSSTQLFYEPGFNVIDATILEDNDQFYMFIKNETDKIIRMTTSENADGPWGEVSDPLTPSWCEGPSAIKIDDKYFVYFDKYTSGTYGVIQSEDLENWTDITAQLNMPAGTNHGTAFSVPYDVIDYLIAYGD